MAFLTGPNVPLSIAMAQMVRSNRAEPYGLHEDEHGSAVEAALCQLAGLMHRFLGILEILAAKPKPVEKDDFMRGWGEPGGDIEEF